MENRKYQTASALLNALSDRLKQRAASGAGDIQTMRRQVAFDRLLVRLFSKEPSLWVLKGGYALEIRIAISQVFSCRNSHQLPRRLAPPPHIWSKKFKSMSEECQLHSRIIDPS